VGRVYREVSFNTLLGENVGLEHSGYFVFPPFYEGNSLLIGAQMTNSAVAKWIIPILSIMSIGLRGLSGLRGHVFHPPSASASCRQSAHLAGGSSEVIALSSAARSGRADCSCCGALIKRTGQSARCSTDSATLPIKRRRDQDRSCVPITMRSHATSLAVERILSVTFPQASRISAGYLRSDPSASLEALTL
jgi:hypothetical protein